jgi:hypothetical protein
LKVATKAVSMAMKRAARTAACSAVTMDDGMADCSAVSKALT